MLRDLEFAGLIILNLCSLWNYLLLSKNGFKLFNRYLSIYVLVIVVLQFSIYLSLDHLGLSYYNYYFLIQFFYFDIIYRTLLSVSLNRNKNDYFDNIPTVLAVISLLSFIYLLLTDDLETFQNVYFILNILSFYFLFKSLYLFLRFLKSIDKKSQFSEYLFQLFILFSIVTLTSFVYNLQKGIEYSTFQISYLFFTYFFIYHHFIVFKYLLNNYKLTSKDIKDEHILVNKVKINKQNVSLIESDKYKKSRLYDADIEEIIKKIRIVETNKMFLNPELNLEILSKELHISKYSISQAINLGLKLNFKDYVNKLRCEYAANLLLNNFHSDTILEIGYKSGFNSKTSFYRAFQKFYNSTPSNYILK